jgi:Pumilio-family RNA binding repeat.
LAFHAYGCRVIQRILEYTPPEKVFQDEAQFIFLDSAYAQEADE